MKEPLYGKTLDQLTRIAVEEGLPEFAGRQMADWLYKKHAGSFQEMMNLSKEARARLDERFTLEARPPLQCAQSADGTRKYLFPAAEQGFVEAAYIPAIQTQAGRGGGPTIPAEERATLCLSVQIGCKMGCLFCMTGRQGFQGNLTPGEILNQYRSLPERDRVTNIVYMGMGEPLDNLDNVLASLEILTSEYGYGLSPTRITVSTVGLIPAVERFLDESRCHLAVSLHSPFDDERRSLMPVQNVHPMKDVLEILRARALRGQRRVSFEYIMFSGVNDSPRHAAELVRILNCIRCRVNLIPFHPVPGAPLLPSPPDVMARFKDMLNEKGVLATVRHSRGLDIAAACGLLSTRELVKRRGQAQ